MGEVMSFIEVCNSTSDAQSDPTRSIQFFESQLRSWININIFISWCSGRLLVPQLISKGTYYPLLAQVSGNSVKGLDRSKKSPSLFDSGRI